MFIFLIVGFRLWLLLVYLCLNQIRILSTKQIPDLPLANFVYRLLPALKLRQSSVLIPQFVFQFIPNTLTLILST